MEALKAVGAKVIKTHGNKFSVSGTPDLFGVWQGIPFLIECKNETGTVEELQELEIIDWRKAGAIAFSTRTKKEAMRILSMEIAKRGLDPTPLMRYVK